MCGIAAVINGTVNDVKLMGNAIKKRGLFPSITEIDNIAVYFTWLPITDFQAQQQPFVSGKYTVWLNGFISNYKELATKYNIKLQSKCDTELLAKLLDKKSPNVLNELNGFFSILYYDGSNLFTITDRYGIKQLYQYKQGNTTYICSEVKGIKAVCELEYDHEAIEDWKYSLGVMTDNTIYKGVTKAPRIAMPEISKQDISYEDAKIELLRLWQQSVRRNKVEDISDCVFLSGGIDSGVIAKWMQPDYSFSVDYFGSLSEIENIKLNSIGKHYTIICNDDLLSSSIHNTLEALDDLKAGSCYTNYALTELACNFATVIYSGAGGDEFFGGYPHRLSNPINEVIKRTSYNGRSYDISHHEYDLRFLRAVLIVEDRMSGQFAMETRYPLLDNDLVNFARSLPDEYLEGKKILKDISGLDEKILTSKKKGFSNPITNQDWINFTLKYLNYE